MEFRVAKSLLQLRTQVDAMAPGRDKSSDGTIGDQSHQGRISDHNPDANGVVTAMDITNDPSHGMDAGVLAEKLRLSQDPRIKYVISNRRIFSSTQTPWVWRPYNGPNAHTEHVHVSVIDQPALYDDVRPWTIESTSTVRLPMQGPSATRFSNIVATVFGGQADRETSAYDGHIITDVEFGVALPFHFPGTRPKVRVINNLSGKSVVCDIVDVGPWETNDPYWTTGSRPRAESGVSSDGRTTNLAGIDLTSAVAGAVGINGKGMVDWEFAAASQTAQGVSNMTTPANDIVTALQQLLAAFQALQNPQQPAAPAQPQTPPAASPQTQPATAPTDLIKTILDVLTAATNPSGTKPLGQVNGALGDTIGNLLDGKKTAIGTIGALVTSLLSFATTAAPTGAAGTTGLSGLGQVLAPLIPAAGLSGFAMPIFLALAAWGFIGKLEKWSGNSAPPAQK